MTGVGRDRTAHAVTSPAAALLGHGLLIGAVAWGAFAFGAVYPWAYWPLAVAAALIAIAGLTLPLPAGTRRVELSLAVPVAAFLVAIIIQLIPLPASTVAAISPSAPQVLSELDPALRSGLVSAHPLSIAPSQTFTGAVLVAAFACLLFGATRLFSVLGVRRTARAIAIIGVLLGLAGIIQQSLYNGKIYGFWTPETAGLSYGPFVNRNHFAGWMLMGLPVTLGLLFSRVSRGMGTVRGTFRDRVLWLGSADASSTALLAGGAMLMTIALMLTMSRSGMAVAAVAVTATAVVAARRQSTGAKKFASVAIVAAVAVIAVSAIGVSTIFARFGSADANDFNARRGAWADAAAIARQFPLAGTGFNTYGVSTLFYQRHDLEQHYAQAHNDYLQLAAEGGALLTIPAVACVVALAAAIRRRFQQETSTTTYWIRAGAVTGICAIAIQELVEFSLQMPGNGFLFVVLCAIALHRTPVRRLARNIDHISEGSRFAGQTE